MGEPKERRPKIPHKIQLDIAFRDNGLCCLCFNVILGDEPRILEHKVPRAMFKNRADADKPGNLGWAHKHCADIKTRGCTGTSKKGSVANGDTHKIAKAVRMEKERLGDVFGACGKCGERVARKDGVRDSEHNRLNFTCRRCGTRFWVGPADRLTPAALDAIIGRAKAAISPPLVVKGEDGRDKYILTTRGILFERDVADQTWIDRGKPKKRSGFRKDPTRVRGVDGKVKARKPRLDRG